MKRTVYVETLTIISIVWCS